MKLVAITRILNESDIVEAFVRHSAGYVDHHIFLDNGSTDGTLAILKALHDEGFGVTVYHSPAVFFNEATSGTFLYERAVIDHDAGWVMPLDADEFIDDRKLAGGLRDFLDRFARDIGDVSVLRVPLRDYVATPRDLDVVLITGRILHCKAESTTHKVIVKGNLIGRNIRLQPGSHSVRIDNNRECPSYTEEKLSYAHYPTRSAYQWISKFVIGWAKIKATGPKILETRASYHYQGPFNYLKHNPEAILRNAYHMQMLSNPADLVHDPMIYRGSELVHTPSVDYPMKCVSVIISYLDELATRHGEMLEWMQDRTSLLPGDDHAHKRII
jgi:glycosyltransferase involved in cell wall biosynthesis